MIDFLLNSILGLLLLIIGIAIFIYITKKRIQGDKGGYGNHSEIYIGAIILFFVGLYMLIREFMNL